MFDINWIHPGSFVFGLILGATLMALFAILLERLLKPEDDEE